MARWKIVVIIVPLIIVIVGFFGYVVPQIQKSSECDDITSSLNREADELNEESRILNEEINNFNRELTAYNKEWLPSPSYTQQIEQMKSDLNEKSIRLEERIKAHDNNIKSIKDKCNLELT